MPPLIVCSGAFAEHLLHKRDPDESASGRSHERSDRRARDRRRMPQAQTALLHKAIQDQLSITLRSCKLNTCWYGWRVAWSESVPESKYNLDGTRCGEQVHDARVGLKESVRQDHENSHQPEFSKRGALGAR